MGHLDDDQLDPDDDDAEVIEENPTAARRSLLRTASENRKLKPPLSRSCLLVELRPCRSQHLAGVAIWDVEVDGDYRCGSCGCSTFQEIALDAGVAELPYTKRELRQRDFYDNTSLFYYISSTYFSVKGLKTLVANGADIMVQNSSGESFMDCFVWDRLPRGPPNFRHATLGIVQDDSMTFYNELIDPVLVNILILRTTFSGTRDLESITKL